MIYIVPFLFEEKVFVAKKSEEETVCRINMQCMWRR